MNNSKKAEKRHEEIRSLLIKNDMCLVDDFCTILQVSEATVRNDLAYLEKKGVLKRIRGGAIYTDGTPKETALLLRNSLCRAEKRKIACYVAEHLVTPGMVIALDAGSTCRMIAEELVRQNVSCTVVTNSLVAASELIKASQIVLHLAGGKYDSDLGAFHDEVTCACLSRFFCDRYFLSPDGISTGGLITDTGTDEHFVKLKLIEQSKEIVVVADHTKLNRPTLKVLCDVKDVSRLLTDEAASIDFLELLKEKQLIVDIAR